MGDFVENMINMSIFVERLDELLFYNNLNAVALAKQMGINPSIIYTYRTRPSLPSYDTAIKFADNLHCTLDFLFGRTDNNEVKNFKACPPFSKQIVFLTEHFEISVYALSIKAKIAQSTIFNWKNKGSIPTIENVDRLANFFECSMDYIVGREI